MKTIQFTTITARTFNVQFVEDDFFDWMKIYGFSGLKIENQVCLYLNHKHKLDLNVRNDSVQSIKYKFNKSFFKKYQLINDSLKYNL